ncbi:hypothetical protein PIB30_060668, partial [Stylosanthes scabra]|nr:hypothetical protein [Stylosanthes scabra]
KLFSVTQWEPIQEWIAVKCEVVQFQVYVKEFGGDVLSDQVHPKESSKPSESCSTCHSVEETPMMLVGDKANTDVEPLIEDAPNANLVSEQGCMEEGGGGMDREGERSGAYQEDNMSKGRFVGEDPSASKGEGKVQDEAQIKQNPVE